MNWRLYFINFYGLFGSLVGYFVMCFSVDWDRDVQLCLQLKNINLQDKIFFFF